jgi:chromosomal replication initiator protein
MIKVVHNPVPRIAPIKQAVAEFYEVDVAALSAKARPERLVLPRHVAMYLCRRLTRYSVQEIAAAFGGRDHATVCNAVVRIRQRMELEPDTSAEINLLLARVDAILTTMFPNGARHPAITT